MICHQRMVQFLTSVVDVAAVVVAVSLLLNLLALPLLIITL